MFLYCISCIHTQCNCFYGHPSMLSYCTTINYIYTRVYAINSLVVRFFWTNVFFELFERYITRADVFLYVVLPLRFWKLSLGSAPCLSHPHPFLHWGVLLVYCSLDEECNSMTATIDLTHLRTDTSFVSTGNVSRQRDWSDSSALISYLTPEDKDK